MPLAEPESKSAVTMPLAAGAEVVGDGSVSTRVQEMLLEHGVHGRADTVGALDVATVAVAVRADRTVSSDGNGLHGEVAGAVAETAGLGAVGSEGVRHCGQYVAHSAGAVDCVADLALVGGGGVVAVRATYFTERSAVAQDQLR